MLLNFQPILTGTGRQSNDPFLWLKIVLETRRSSASLELLSDFLVCLEPELWPKNPVVLKNPKTAKKT